MRFVGAWDTVDAYGLPFDGLKALAAWATQLLGPFSWVRFADRSVSPHVDYAAHALSLDDARRTFHPVLWDERTAETADGGAPADRADAGTTPIRRIDQVWFAGAHADVGGGYEKDSLSLVPLHWMMNRAESVGLRFLRDSRDRIAEHRDVLGPQHDPRSNLGMFYRYAARDVGAMCRRDGLGPPRVHASVTERVRRSRCDLAPDVLLPEFVVVDDDGSGTLHPAVAPPTLAFVHTLRLVF